MSTTSRDKVLVLFNRDLRLADHPALSAAVELGDVLPLFVLSPAMLARCGPNRFSYLRDALLSLDAALRERGSQLHVAIGEPATEALRVAHANGVNAIHVSEDYSRLARARQAALNDGARRTGIVLRCFEGIAAVAPGHVRPSGGAAFQVFTPYSRRWLEVAKRTPLPSPKRLPWSAQVVGVLELQPALQIALQTTPRAAPSAQLPRGGEHAARLRLRAWLRRGVQDYDTLRDQMDVNGTSRISADLHFGCLTAAQLIYGARKQPAAAGWIRQLCWRDFFLQALATFPALATRAFQPHARAQERFDWQTTDRMASHARYASARDADPQFRAWCAGNTGIPIVDAGMRQLLAEGWMHNRARMLVASYLTRQLQIDWRLGLAHFEYWLVDGDLAVNSGNWQWAAGTGHDRRPGRRFNLLRQALRFDPQGDYVRRYVEPLRDIPGAAVHQPWQLSLQLNYPPPQILL